MAAKAKHDPRDLHPVMLALGKAQAAAMLAKILTAGDDYLTIPDSRLTDKDKADMRAWFVDIAERALDDALTDATASFRDSLTPEQAIAQIVGGPKAAVA